MAALKSWLGGVIAGLVIYVVALVFWATPLSLIAYNRVDEGTNANLQAALNQALTPSGTGVYVVPDPSLGGASTLYTQGPVAKVYFNTGGFPVLDTSALIGGLVLAVVIGLLLAEGLRLAARWVPDPASRTRVLLALVLAPLLWVHLGQPIFEHTPWVYSIYALVADFAALFLGGWVVLRWFLPESRLVAGLEATSDAERQQEMEARRERDRRIADGEPVDGEVRRDTGDRPGL